MREIKFRAWHKNRKKYYKVMHLHIETSLNGGVWATCEGFNIIKQDNVKIQVQPGDCIIEQFTGLKDKNGVEIYEGDIVKTYLDFGPGGEVHNNILVGYCKLSAISIQLWVYDNPTYWWPEIIGNIHENPELLKHKLK